MCGMATTVKEARRVPANRVEVAVERGWRCGGILAQDDVAQRGGVGGLRQAVQLGGWT